MQKDIDFLLNEGCHSIRYRVKKEIISGLALGEIEELKAQIYEDDLVKEFISIQRPNGWIDQDFHSEKGIETAVRVLCEKGLDAGDSVISKMLKQLEKREYTFDQGCLFRVGKILDQLSLGGSQLIRAVIFAYTGVEDKTFILGQIKETLNAFRYVIDVNSINDIAVEYKGKLVFKPAVRWPSIYHLRLLAYTKCWRNDENLRMLVNSMQRLVDLSPIPPINGLYKSQLVSPGSFCMHDFKTDMQNLDAKGWMMWFHRMELLARIGVVKSIPEFNSQLNYLKNAMNEKSSVFHKKRTHYYFMRWGTYTGLALEQDWKTKKRYLCDLLFRSLLIVHYSEKV